MLINSSAPPRSSTVTQPTTRPSSSANQTSSSRTKFGSSQAADRRASSLKTNSDRGVPNPISSSSPVEEFDTVTIAGMSSRVAGRRRTPELSPDIAPSSRAFHFRFASLSPVVRWIVGPSDFSRSKRIDA